MVGDNENFMNGFGGNNDGVDNKSFRRGVEDLSEAFQDAASRTTDSIYNSSKGSSKFMKSFFDKHFRSSRRQSLMDSETDEDRFRASQLHYERLYEENRAWQEVFFGNWFRRNKKYDDLRNDELVSKMDKIRSGINDLGIGAALSSLSNNTTSSMERQLEHIKEIRTELGLSGKQWNILEGLVDEKVYNPLNKQFDYIFSQEDKLDSINDAVDMGARSQEEILKLMPYLLKWQKVGGDMSAEDMEFVRPVLDKMGEGALDTIGDTASKLSQEYAVSFKDLFTSLNNNKMYNEIMTNSNGNAEVFKKSTKSFMGAITMMKESFIDSDTMSSLLMDISKKSISELSDSGITQQLALAGLSVQDLKDEIKSGNFMEATNEIVQGLGEFVEQNPDMAENIAGILGYDVDFLNELGLYHDDANEAYGKIKKSIEDTEGSLDERLHNLPVSLTEKMWNRFESLPFVRSVVKFIQNLELGMDDVFYAMGIVKLLPDAFKTGLADLGKGIIEGFGKFVDDMVSSFGSIFKKTDIPSAPAGSKGSTVAKKLLGTSDDATKSSTKLLGSADDLASSFKPDDFIEASYTVVDDVAKSSDDVLKTVGKTASKSADDLAKSASFMSKIGSKAGKWLGPLGLLVGAGASAATIAKADDKKKAVTTEAGGWIGGMAGGAAGGAALGTAVGGPIGTAVGAIVGGIAGSIGGEKVAEWMYDNFDKIKEKASDAGKWVGDKFNAGWESIQSVWNSVATWFQETIWTPVAEFASSAWDSICGVWNSVADWFTTNVWDPVKTFAQNTFYFFVGLGAYAWEGIVAIWQGVSSWFDTTIWTPLSNAATNAMNWIQTSFSNAWNWIVGLWQGFTAWFDNTIWIPLSTAVSNAAQNLFNGFTNAWNWISGLWQGVSTWFSNTIWTPLSNSASSLGSSIYSFFSGAWSNIQGIWSSVSSWFSNNIWGPISTSASNTWSRITSTISGVVDSFKSAWSGLSSWFNNTVLSPITTMWNNTIGAFSNGFSKISGWFGSVIDKGKQVINGSKRTGMSYTPYDGFVAELHKGEVVKSSDGTMSSKVPYDGLVTTLDRGDEVMTAYAVRSMERSVASSNTAESSYMDPGVGATSIEAMNSYFDQVSKYIKVSANTSLDDSSSSGSLTGTTASSNSSLVNAARSFKGAKYVWGGKDYPSLDCSGLVSSAFEKVGWVDSSYKYNNNAQAIRSQSTPLSSSSANAGDLAFLVEGGEATHIGIVAGKNSNGKNIMIHSSTGYGGYAEEDTTNYWNAWGRFSKAKNNSSSNGGSTTGGSPKGSSSQVSFIEELAPGAVKARSNGSTFPSVTMSQGILESGWGKSTLATKAKNLFGIKAGTSWSGATVDMPTTEYSGGVPYSTIAKFRAYNSFSDSIEDHANLLKNNSRYAKVLSSSSYKQATQALKDAGYATDPNYPSLLNNIIEDYNLSSYDTASLADTSLGSTESGKDAKAPAVTVNVENKELVETLRWQVAELSKAYASASQAKRESSRKQSPDVASIFNFT